MNIYEAYKRTTTNQIKQMARETGIALNTFYAIFNGTPGGRYTRKPQELLGLPVIGQGALF